MLLRFSHEEHNCVCGGCYSNEHKIFSFQRRFEILDGDGL